MKKIILFASFAVLFLICIYPSQSLLAASNALALCQKTLIPSLFPFMVCSNLLISLGGTAYFQKFTKFITSPLFKICGSGSMPFVLGLLSGYPCGAVTTCNLYSAGAITKNEAHRLLSFTNNSGPLFIISAVGVSMYQSHSAGVILYVSHLLSAVTMGFVASFFKSDKNNNSQDYTPTKKSPSAAVSDSVQSVLTLCGYVMFFSVLLSLMQKMGVIDMITKAFCFLKIPHPVSKLISCGIFEITTALSASNCTYLPAVSAVISFGGISVLFQTMSFTQKSNLSIKPYILGKILCSGFSALYTKILLYFFPVSVNVFSQPKSAENIAAIPYIYAFLISGSIFLFFYIKAMPQGDK